MADKQKPGGFISKMQEKHKAHKEFLVSKAGEDTILMTGDPALDWCQGGFKRFKSNLLYGPTKSGKSTIALIMAAIEQKKTGGWVVIFDSEYAHEQTDPDVIERWKSAGLDPEKVIAISSNQVDELFGNIGDLESDAKAIKNGKPNSGGLDNISAIVVDSWGGIQSEQAREKMDGGDVASAGNSYGGNAKTINPILQSLLRMSAEYGITSFFVQHCIENMDRMPNGAYKGGKWILLGGQKLRYLCHNIMFIEAVDAADSFVDADGNTVSKEDGAAGKKVRAKCEKSRRQVEGRKAETWIDFSSCRFVASEVSLFNLASRVGVIFHPKFPDKDSKGVEKTDKQGNVIYKENKMYWQYVGRNESYYGKPKIIAALKEDKDLFKSVYDSCMNTSDKDAVGGDLVGDEEGVSSTEDEDQEEAEDSQNLEALANLEV